MKIFFIRHGQTNTNIKGLIHAVNDPSPLTEEGIRQAFKAAEECKKYCVQAVYCSSELRAKETTNIVVRETRAQQIEITELGERDWGQWGGKPWDEIKNRLNKMSLEQRYSFVPPHGESWEQMDKRLLKALNIITSSKNNAVAVITHGGVLRALLPIIKNQPKESTLQYDPKNTEIIVFDYTNGKFTEE